MTKTITLTNVKIQSLKIDVDTQSIVVHYLMKDATGSVSVPGTATFVHELPTDGNGNPIVSPGSNLVVMPQVDYEAAVMLYSHALAYITNNILVE